jgi:hypothetical protein
MRSVVQAPPCTRGSAALDERRRALHQRLGYLSGWLLALSWQLVPEGQGEDGSGGHAPGDRAGSRVSRA